MPTSYNMTAWTILIHNLCSFLPGNRSNFLAPALRFVLAVVPGKIRSIRKCNERNWNHNALCSLKQQPQRRCENITNPVGGLHCDIRQRFLQARNRLKKQTQSTQYSSVGIATRLHAGLPRNRGVDFPSRGKIFSFTQRADRLCGHPDVYPMDTGGFLPGNKADRPWNWPLPLYGAEVENALICTTSSPHVLVGWSVIKHRDIN
jgi:hypothetical protein